MPHLGAAELPVLAAIVAGTVASSFALLDYRMFGETRFGVPLLALTVVMVLFTAYHLALVADAGLPATNDAFGGVVETIIAVVAIALVVRRRWGGGVRQR